MKKNFVVSFFTLLLFGLSLFIFDSNEVKAATIGEQLKELEIGWKRYDDTDNAIIYSGTDWRVDKLAGYFNGSVNFTLEVGDYVSFKFKGTKMRIISDWYHNKSKNIEIQIDGVSYYYNQHTLTIGGIPQALSFEKIDLTDDYHTVKIINNDGKIISLDAIDIDSEGYLIPLDIESPILNGEVKGEGHALTWNSIEGARGYNVKRSLNAGGPYDVIASNVTTNSYLDNDIEKGKKYYYVVTTVVNGAESENSNEVILPIIENSNATLVLHLLNNQIKEYNLTSSELNNFRDWIASGSESFYVFTQKSPEPPYNYIEDYIIKDKIVWFQVKKY